MAADKKQKRSFLVNTERFNPILLKQLDGKEDILSFRKLQGEMADLYKFLTVSSTGLAQSQNLVINLNPTPEEKQNKHWLSDDGPKLHINYAHSMHEKVVKEVVLKHLAAALEELKTISLEFILEDIKEIPLDGNVDELVAFKETLKEKSDTGSADENTQK